MVPGFDRWGCRPPGRNWSGYPDPFADDGAHGPPEVVVKSEVELAADGTAKIRSTRPRPRNCSATAITGTRSRSKSRIRSRRTITSSSTILVRPRSVPCPHLDRPRALRGRRHRRSRGLNARTLDGKGVAGRGRLTLTKISNATRRASRSRRKCWRSMSRPMSRGQRATGSVRRSRGNIGFLQADRREGARCRRAGIFSSCAGRV